MSGGPSRGRWRLVDAGAPARSGARNMGIDRALLEGVRAGGAAVLRFYTWDPPCLSLGRNQPAAGLYDPAAAAARGIDIVRRPTGGRAVLHDHELTYSVIVPVGVLGSPRESYATINRALVAGLRRLGVPAMVVEASAPAPRRTASAAGRPAPAPHGGPEQALGPRPCFDAAAPGEVVAGGRKLIGSAQRREGTSLLQHGSLLLEDDQVRVLELRSHAGVSATAVAPGRAPRAGASASMAGATGATGATGAAPPATLRELLGRVPPREDLEAALVRGFEETLAIRLVASPLTGEEQAATERWARHFATAAWTWRR